MRVIQSFAKYERDARRQELAQHKETQQRETRETCDIWAHKTQQRDVERMGPHNTKFFISKGENNNGNFFKVSKQTGK